MRLNHLDLLESEAIHVLREAVAEAERPVLLFSGGKDSAVLLHLAVKAFWPAPLPFPVLHVDTGHNFPEVIAYRDAEVDRLGLRLVVAEVEDSIRRGRAEERPGESRNALQIVTLLDALREHRFDASFGGARRDEERARAKERFFSFRDKSGQWEPRAQRPELWTLYNARVHRGEHVRVFPLSNFTELDVWLYVARERIRLPSLYFSHEREVFERDDMIFAVNPHLALEAHEQPFRERVRFRTVGDMTCTGAVRSHASTLGAIIEELELAKVTERGAGRADDRAMEGAMEERKRLGYF